MNGVRWRAEAVTVVAVADPRSGAATALAACGAAVVARTTVADAAMAAIERARPQVVVLDASTAGVAAPEFVARVAGRAPVLAVSGSAEHAAVLATVRAGAAGYLVGPLVASRLAEALVRVAAGEEVFSPGLAALVLDEQAVPASAPRLTEREVEVVRLIVEGCTSRQIAARLVLSPRTVEHHVQEVLRRLGVPNRAALVRHATDHGLV